MAHSSETSSTVAQSAGASDVPVVSFENVSLAFDDNVVLREVSFSVALGHMKILLGASGSGKSVILKLMGAVGGWPACCGGESVAW